MALAEEAIPISPAPLTSSRDDAYRRPVEHALAEVGVGAGWHCLDAGAGRGDVSVVLASLVGSTGRVWAVDVDPAARDEVAERAAAFAQVVTVTQAVEELTLPEAVDLAFCRFLLLHVRDPLVALSRMASAVRPGGWVVAAEPITSAGRVGGVPMSAPAARHPDVGAQLPALARAAGLELVDAWGEAPAGAGPGPVATYLEQLTGVDPGQDAVVLPVLVTVIARRAD